MDFFKFMEILQILWQKIVKTTLNVQKYNLIHWHYFAPTLAIFEIGQFFIVIKGQI